MCNLINTHTHTHTHTLNVYIRRAIYIYIDKKKTKKKKEKKRKKNFAPPAHPRRSPVSRGHRHPRSLGRPLALRPQAWSGWPAARRADRTRPPGAGTPTAMSSWTHEFPAGMCKECVKPVIEDLENHGSEKSIGSKLALVRLDDAHKLHMPPPSPQPSTNFPPPTLPASQHPFARAGKHGRLCTCLRVSPSQKMLL